MSCRNRGRKTRLWIIGNGFDLYHGLKTCYGDYKAYLCHQHACGLKKKQREHKSHGLRCAVCENCCKSYRNTNCPIRKFDELPRVESKEGLWRDVEKACSIDLNMLTDRLKGEYVGGIGRSEDNASIALLYGSLQFVKAFTGNEFYEWLCTVEGGLDDINEKRLNLDEGDLYLTFNYTSVLQKVYAIPDERIYYVHGCIEEVKEELNRIAREDRDVSKNSVVHSRILFGSPTLTDDAVHVAVDHFRKSQVMSDKQAEDLCNHLRQLSKFLYKDVQGRLETMKRWVMGKCRGAVSVDEVVLAGHSLGEIDSPYFNFLANYFSGTKWQFLFYSKEDMERSIEFCERHRLYGYYTPWNTASRISFRSIPCPCDSGALCPGFCACKR